MGTGETKLHAIDVAKLFKIIVGVFGAIITLELFNFSCKLCNNYIKYVEIIMSIVKYFIFIFSGFCIILI